eukprot:296888_1
MSNYSSFFICVIITSLSYNIFIFMVWQYFRVCSNDDSEYKVYKGPTYSKPGITLSKHILFETHNIGLSYHSVLFANQDHIINDWMYFDVPTEIVIVYFVTFTFNTKNQKNINSFILFNETSYSYKGESLAPIYGIINFGMNESSIDAIQRLLKTKLNKLNQSVNANIFENINNDKLTYFNEFILDANRCRGDHYVYLIEKSIILESISEFNALQSYTMLNGLHFVECNQLYELLLYDDAKIDIILVKNSNALVWAWWTQCN